MAKADVEPPLILSRVIRFLSPILLLLGAVAAVPVIGEEAPHDALVIISTPIVPAHTSRPTSTHTRISTPTETPEILPTPNPSSTPVPSPTPTLDAVTQITTDAKLNAVVSYLRVVDTLLRDEYQFGAELVLSVMAAESGGEQFGASADGLSCGVMQVVPKSWYRYTEQELCDSYWANIDQGMIILYYAIARAQEQGYDLRYGVAYYNCLETSVQAGGCGKYGGLHYADKVLNFWLPRVTERVKEHREYLVKVNGG